MSPKTPESSNVVPEGTVESPDMMVRIEQATALLAALFKSVGMPESHGLDHCLTVLAHMRAAVKSTDIALTDNQNLSLHLAALLHEADDHKYFKSDSTNAHHILNSVLQDLPAPEREAVCCKVLEMISYVSASANGNRVPPQAVEDPTLLWPRFCDRLEAIGVIGAVRCWQYAEEKGNPMSTDQTPRPKDESEVWSHVTEERWARYQQQGNSDSMMDHYYDKLLQIARFDAGVVRNPYLSQEASKRVEPLVRICLEFGRTGAAPVELIRSFL